MLGNHLIRCDSATFLLLILINTYFAILFTPSAILSLNKTFLLRYILILTSFQEKITIIV
jgi:hypothetical protein